ncbi:signal peptidase I [Bacillus sp. JJ664]
MKVFTRFINIFMLVVLLLMSYKVIEGKMKGEPPTFFGHQVYYVISGSMEPTLKTGSIILVKQWTNHMRLVPGDIITFRMPYNEKILVTHRIKEIVKGHEYELYRTKGDANPIQDPWIITSKSIVSIYSGVTIPLVGYFYEEFQANIILYLLVMLFGIILVSYGFHLIRKPDKNSEEL